MTNKTQINQLTSGKIPKFQLFLNLSLTSLYLSWWLIPRHVDNPLLFGLLLSGEIYHVLMLLLFWFTTYKLGSVSSQKYVFNSWYQPDIDVFITVAGEPIEIVRHTLQHIQTTNYDHKHIYLLNDSYVAKKDNWHEYELLAKELGIGYFTRKKAGGAKAGNINHALAKTKSELIAIFDADMAPKTDFFQKTIPFFSNRQVGFVQTPQYYQNNSNHLVAQAAWEQQEFFYGPIMKGKNYHNAAFICGTNVVIRRETLESVGGINELSIAEDFLTSLYIHAQGWKSVYIDEILAQGLAPEDLNSYYKQQLRWARGSIEILFKHNPLTIKGLTWAQRLEYLSSSLFYVNGVVVLINISLPIIFLLTGISPINSATTIFAAYFLPFIAIIIYSLHVISNQTLTLRAIAFTQSSWALQLQALFFTLIRQKTAFKITPKSAQSGNYLFLALPHLFYLLLAGLSVVLAINRNGFTPSVITNVSWVCFNILLFLPFVSAAIPHQTINFATLFKQSEQKLKLKTS
jgi:cellulose synthase (UDP-forming)